MKKTIIQMLYRILRATAKPPLCFQEPPKKGAADVSQSFAVSGLDRQANHPLLGQLATVVEVAGDRDILTWALLRPGNQEMLLEEGAVQS